MPPVIPSAVDTASARGVIPKVTTFIKGPTTLLARRGDNKKKGGRESVLMGSRNLRRKSDSATLDRNLPRCFLSLRDGVVLCEGYLLQWAKTCNAK